MTVAVAALMPVTAHAQSAETTPPELADSNTATDAESEAPITVVGLRGKPPTHVDRPIPVDVLICEELRSTRQTDLSQQVQRNNPAMRSRVLSVLRSRMRARAARSRSPAGFTR